MRPQLAAVLVALGCGPGDGSDPAGSTSDASSGTDASDSQSSGSSTTNVTTGSTSSASTSSTSSSTGGACDGFANAYGPSVPVTITNTSDAPVYLQVDGCNMTVSIGVVDAATQTPIGTLHECWTCQTALASSCVCPGPPCFISAGLRLDPGATYETAAGATAYHERQIPLECPISPDCGLSCLQAAPLPEGEYAVRVLASDQVSCDGAVCDCTPGPEGWCWIEADGMLQAATDYAGPFSIPDPAPVAISVP